MIINYLCKSVSILGLYIIFANAVSGDDSRRSAMFVYNLGRRTRYDSTSSPRDIAQIPINSSIKRVYNSWWIWQRLPGIDWLCYYMLPKP